MYVDTNPINNLIVCLNKYDHPAVLNTIKSENNDKANKTPQIINVGDTVWIAPNEEHWHGATKENSMEHIAIHETMNGQVANWLEQVSDIDYNI